MFAMTMPLRIPMAMSVTPSLCRVEVLMMLEADQRLNFSDRRRRPPAAIHEHAEAVCRRRAAGSSAAEKKKVSRAASKPLVAWGSTRIWILACSSKNSTDTQCRAVVVELGLQWGERQARRQHAPKPQPNAQARRTAFR